MNRQKQDIQRYVVKPEVKDEKKASTFAIVSYKDLKFKEQIEDGIYNGEWQNRPVVIKVLDSSGILIGDPHDFEQKTARIAKMQHRNLVKVHGIIISHGCIIMEAMIISLHDLLQQQSLRWDTKFRIAHDIVRGLEYLHDQQHHIHGCLTSRKILLDEKLNAKIIVSPETTSFHEGITDKIRWVAPEQVLGETATTATNIYTLGVILYELASGKKPYHNKNLHQVWALILQQHPPEPYLEERTEIPKFWRTIIEMCWQAQGLRPNIKKIAELFADQEKESSSFNCGP